KVKETSIEQIMSMSFDRVISNPTLMFRKVVVGINCNVDLIVKGTDLIKQLGVLPNQPDLNDECVTLKSLTDLQKSFLHFFTNGIPGEKYMDNEELFKKIVSISEKNDMNSDVYIGGNAALMAQKIASTFSRVTPHLVGPIGPRIQKLLHPMIVRDNSTRIVKDELHVIMEYKQGEMLENYMSPASSRFITSQDQLSGSRIVIEMFFKAIQQYKPDLVIIAGLHVLEPQSKDIRREKMILIKQGLYQLPPELPLHLELSTISDLDFARHILKDIIPRVDSLTLSERCLNMLAKAVKGPSVDYPSSARILHVHKAVEMLHWLMQNYGHRKDKGGKDMKRRLTRIHFHCSTYHMIVSTGTDWSNLASGLAAGARVAGRYTCGMRKRDTNYDLLEVRFSSSYLLDEKYDKVYTFDPANPIASWMRDDIVFMFTPVLVCKFAARTVGAEDSISATALIHSQFYAVSK
uniref:ADP-dependent glucokinase n=2 Tax=Strongyloides stercoralis TaxID=6248 RepID=A0AAF5DKL0_STRER